MHAFSIALLQSSQHPVCAHALADRTFIDDRQPGSHHAAPSGRLDRHDTTREIAGGGVPTRHRHGTIVRYGHDVSETMCNTTRHRATAQSGKERRWWYRLPGDDVHPLSRSGIAAERLRSPSVSAPHRESLARPTGPGLLTYLIVPKVTQSTQRNTAYRNWRIRN